MVRPNSTPSRRMLSRMSPFSTCENSCAITPCSSSRLSRVSVPRVTAITASLIEWPAAKALIEFSSSITNTRGTGTPDAMAISSTMFSRRRSSRSRVDGSSGRAPTIFATASPPDDSAFISTTVPPPIRPTTTSVLVRKKPLGRAAGVQACPVGVTYAKNRAAPARLTATTTQMTARANSTTSRLVVRRATSWCSKKSTGCACQPVRALFAPAAGISVELRTALSPGGVRRRSRWPGAARPARTRTCSR